MSAVDLRIPGLEFRPYRGDSDYPVIASLIASCKEHDQIERTVTVEDVTRTYTHLTNCDPAQDVRFAEVDGQPVGYCRSWWFEELEGPWLGGLYGVVLPAWRRKGIGSTLVSYAEQRLRQAAAELESAGTLQPGTPRFFTVEISSTDVDRTALFEKIGYQPVRRGNQMRRPNYENIPEAELPAGLEVRPVLPEHYRLIWDAAQEAFRDHWGFVTPSETDYDEWMQSEEFTPDLWQVAWEGDQVAGMVLNFVNEKENLEYHRKRGYTESISVRRLWRRRGLARALLVRSLRMFRDLGYEEAFLSVDAENLNQAFNLYESVGFQVIRYETTYRKPL
ncbi:MAG: GNAT family N-acetyltransferase [Anaerolineales bacterium]|jgi:ribosomal protein S18 acetylase RimI-like enzyme|nr:GNAT family N-acetyltransferase [Anaerolineales bacterium]